MSKLFYKAMIEDVQNDKCTDAELEALLNAFETRSKKWPPHWHENLGTRWKITPLPNNTALIALR
jgi:hypothetical protein